MNPVIDPFTHKLVNGPEAGQNTEVDGFTVGFIGSTDGTVYNAGSGLTLTGNVFEADVAAVGFGMELAGGTASLARYRAIETVSGATVTMQAGHAYRIYATSAAITLNTETIPANSFGLEGHLEIFVSGTGYVVTGSNVVLANALEPDSVNNCTVRFHDGLAIISVEDHIAGYVVVSATGTTAGTLPYALTSATQEYVAFDASLNGATVSLSGSTANGEKHVVGNGYMETTLTDAVDCGTSKFTVANLALQNVVVNGGVMTLGNAYIPSGSTVAVSGGGLAVEKVTGNGGVIDLGNTRILVAASKANVSGGIVFTGGSSTQHGGAFQLYQNGAYLNITGATITGNVATDGCGIYAGASTGASISSCTIVGNSVEDVRFSQATESIIAESTVGTVYVHTCDVKLNGSNTIEKISGYSGTVILTSGAILDLTGNTNAAPIAPGGGITFESGGATVLYSSGAVSGSYMMDNVTLPTGAKLTNTAAVDLGGTNTGSCKGSMSGVTLTSGRINFHSGATVASDTTLVNSGQLIVYNNTDSAVNTTVSSGGNLYVNSGGVASPVTNNSGGNTYVYFGGVATDVIINGGWVYALASGTQGGGTINNAIVNSGGRLRVDSDGVLNEPVISSGGSLIVSSGGSALLVTSNTGAVVTVLEGGVITYKE